MEKVYIKTEDGVRCAAVLDRNKRGIRVAIGNSVLFLTKEVPVYKTLAEALEDKERK